MTSVTKKKSAKTFSKDQEMVAKYYVFVVKKKKSFSMFSKIFFLNPFKNQRRELKVLRRFH